MRGGREGAEGCQLQGVRGRARRDGVGGSRRAGPVPRGILQGILPGAFDRLGDAKAPVRDAGRELFLALMSSGAVAPAELVGEASPAWRHKNWRVREETLRVVERAFAELDREIEAGELSLPVKAIVAFGARALEDREPAVREAAICAVVAADAAAAAAGATCCGCCRSTPCAPGR